MSEHDSMMTRRQALQHAGAGALGLAAARSALSAPLPVAPVVRLSEHLFVCRGPVNVGIVRDGDRVLLIDCGDGRVARSLHESGVRTVEQVLFTHHHRDQACGAGAVCSEGTRIGVPAAERQWFESPSAYWDEPAYRWRTLSLHPHHLVLTEPVRVDAAYAADDTITWGPARLRVLATPGHTPGSISYLVEADGKRVVFCGDAISDAGQAWDLYSLQSGFEHGGQKILDYHGFLGARELLVEGLTRVRRAEPALLVPSHGRIMNEPGAAIDQLVSGLAGAYDTYVSTSALRHYFPKAFAEYLDRPDHMAIRPGESPPDFVRHVGTSWIITAGNGAAFVIDCGSPGVVDRLKELRARGEIRSVDGVWITHYHFDHTDGLDELRQAFGCPCITDEHVAEVVTRPAAWRLPAISPDVVQVDRATRDGDSWPWQEFTLTAYHFPGQTLHHSGLLVEGRGVRMFFAGDSFTMSGMDDYCAFNRNWLGPGVGFDRCVALLERLQPTHLFNCHVEQAFAFTPEQCRFMRDNLARREREWERLSPWEHVNFALDESWVRTFPYEQPAKAGGLAEVRVRITNHAGVPRRASCRPSPASRAREGRAEDWNQVEIPARSDGEVLLAIRLPAGLRPGRFVVPIDIRFGDRELPQFTEAIFVV
jgi:glyoxylase-like metal-dependent hydrolase (beta-lactamase superfamily II)